MNTPSKEPSLGLVSISFRKLLPKDILSLCVDAGLDVIEWGSDVHCPPVPETAGAVGKLTRAAGLGVSSYGTYYRLGAGQSFDEYLEAARLLGTDTLRLWAGARGSAGYGADDRLNLTREACACAQKAADLGMNIGFEYHPGTLTDTLSSALSLYRDIGADNVGLYWQPDFKKPVSVLLREAEAVSPISRIWHVFYWLPSGERLSLSDGVGFWKSVLPFAKQGPRKTLLLEFVTNDEPGRLGGEAAVLRQLVRDA